MFERIFTEHSQNPGFEWALINGTIIQVHRHGSGAKGSLKVRSSANRAAVVASSESPTPDEHFRCLEKSRSPG